MGNRDELKTYTVMVPVLVELEVMTHLSPENVLVAIMKTFDSKTVDPFLGCPLALPSDRTFHARTTGAELFGGRAYLKQGVKS